jgi:hypothetical protein
MVHSPMRDFLEYLQNDLPRFRPAIAFVALRDNEFNRAKSNIAWIEAAYAGAAVVAPNLPEFEQPGVRLVDPGGLPALDALRQLVDQPKLVRDLNWAARDFIRSSLRLTGVNQLRAQIVEKLLS